MKFFSDCSGECCVCTCGDFCVAGHGDDYFFPASTEQVIKRLNDGQYPNYIDYMIEWLRARGVEYKKENLGKLNTDK